jgi:hypothetical protein
MKNIPALLDIYMNNACNFLKIGDAMKGYTVMIIQLFIWSGFTFIEWLSKHDTLLYKSLMFAVFLYIGFIIGDSILKSARKTVVITFCSLLLYGSIHLSLTWLYRG